MSRPFTIAVTQRKGGDGKTTIATHLAGGLARQGWRVVLIDTDPQGDAARLLGISPDDGLYRWLAEGADLRDELLAVSHDVDEPGELLLLPSSVLTAGISAVNPDVLALADGIDALRDVVDVVVLDTAPTMAPFDAYVKLAAEAYLFIAQPEHLSLEGLADGVAEAARMAERRQEYGLEPSRILGIVPNKVRAYTDVHRHLLVEMGRQYAGLVWPPIMLRTLYTQAATFGDLIWSYRPGSFEATEMTRLVQTAIREMENE